MKSKMLVGIVCSVLMFGCSSKVNDTKNTKLPSKYKVELISAGKVIHTLTYTEYPRTNSYNSFSWWDEEGYVHHWGDTYLITKIEEKAEKAETVEK